MVAYIHHGNLPQTGYIVNLVLLAVQQGKHIERVNEAVLISNMVNFLLGRSNIVGSSRLSLDHISKEITLQTLSVYIREAGEKLI